MAEAESAFERDRSKFLYLLREIDLQLGSEIGKDSFFLGIHSLVREINELELAGRLGFFGRALDCIQRELPWGAEQHVIAWTDPTGGSSEIVTAHFMKVPLIHGTFRHRSDYPEAVSLVKEVVQRWERAVQDISEPRPYPALAMPPPAGVDPALFRDPLWRKLDMAIEQLSRSESSVDTHWDIGRGPPWIQELNALAKYENVGEGALLAFQIARGGDQLGLILYHPAGGSTRTLPFHENGRLDLRSIDEFRSRMIEWRDSRALMLKGGITIEMAKQRPSRSMPRKRGPKVKHDLQADQRLYEAYLSSGIKKYSEFDRARGLDRGDTAKAYYRLKKANLHKTIRAKRGVKSANQQAVSSPTKQSRLKKRRP